MLKLISLLFCIFLLASCSHDYVKPENYQHPQVAIETEFGTMTAELYEEKVPNTVMNFITLAESGFYNEMLFHVNLSGAYLQGGCPNTKIGSSGKVGTGGPGYLISEEIREDLKHDARGILSMAKGRGEGKTGSQFIILYDKLPMMDGQQTVFGKIISGFEVLELLEKNSNKNGSLKREISFNIKVLRKNNLKYKVNKIENKQ